ncbi:transcriptional regulator [Ornithinimicrobium ciconiae]|uniref:Transcriptional regulator n=2 Tax=Ornithinimicrobium ciconiae TaxID=2594265 RepID=A0A516GG37_9MICO|nr:transcriptional regulator [Ornithinimicrobium ciconiae]
MRARLIEHCARRYSEDRASLRVIAAETGRSQTAVRRALAQARVPLRGPGAPQIEESEPG